MANLALPESTSINPSSWKGPDGKLRPEGWTAIIAAICIVGLVLYFRGILLPWLIGMLVDTLHIVYLAGILGGALYLIFGMRPRLMYRVILRKLTSLFVAVYPIEIIEDKLLQMKKRRDKMNEQIALVNGSITKLQRVIQQNHADALKGFGMATQAQKMAGASKDETEQLRMQLTMRREARKAQRREQANIGYQKLLERLQKVYSFLSRYAANVDFFIEDTQDEIEQKKTEYQTTQTAFGAMKQAMAVIKGNATEDDIYSQAFDYIEQSVSTQLGIMDDLQRVSQGFMDSMDIETGSVDEDALKALNAFEQKALTPGNDQFQLVTTDKSVKQPIPVPAKKLASGGGNDFSDLLG